MKGVEPLSFGLQDRRSFNQLSYIACELGAATGRTRSASVLSLSEGQFPIYLIFFPLLLDQWCELTPVRPSVVEHTHVYLSTCGLLSLEFSCENQSVNRQGNWQWRLAIGNDFWWTGRESNPHKKFAGLLCSRLHHQPGSFINCHWTFSICHFKNTPQPFKLDENVFMPGNVKRTMSNDKWKIIWLWVESNHQPFAYETKALPFELHSHEQR